MKYFHHLVFVVISLRSLCQFIDEVFWYVSCVSACSLYTDIDECKNGLHECHRLFADCQNTEGSYICSCKEGFTGSGKNCIDQNECENGMAQCDTFSKCVNIHGSYYCVCNKGYEKNETGHCEG